MRRYAASIAFALAAAAVCLAPLRADDAIFARELEAAVQGMYGEILELVDRAPDSAMAQKLKRLVAGVGAQLLQENKRLMEEKTPPGERIPILRDLYLQQMRRIHDLKPDGSSIVRYNERTQSFWFTSSSSGSRGLGSLYSKISRLLKPQMSLDGDSFAAELNAALQEMREDWRGFVGSYLHIEPVLVFPEFSHLPIDSPVFWMDFPNGIETIILEIEYELTKLDVELAEQNLTPEKRVEQLRDRFFEVLQKTDKLAPAVQFDADAVQLLIVDVDGGSHFTFQFPPALSTVLNTQAVADAKRRRMRLFMVGGAALALLLLAGGVYLVKKLAAGKEDENE